MTDTSEVKFDRVLQDQLEHLSDVGRKSTNARTFIAIAGTGPDVQCAVQMPEGGTSDGRKRADYETMLTAVTVAASLLKGCTGGEFTLFIRNSKGEEKSVTPESVMERPS